MMWLLILLLVALEVWLGVGDYRRQFVTCKMFEIFRKLMPPMASSGKEAMESGDVLWDGGLFCGNPDWNTLQN